jgi:hypothetical protein
MKRGLAVLLPLAAVLAGCASHPPIIDPARRGPFFVPHNVAADASMPVGIHRVVLLPVHGAPYADPEACESLDPVFAAALVHQMRFEVTTVSREECAKSFGLPDIDSTSALPHDFLALLGQKFGAQAVLFVDLTAYGPYRPLTLGIRAKLATVADRRIVWSFDEIFDANQPTVTNAVRHFYLHDEMGDVPFDRSSDALSSPSRFAAYAADTVFHTLPQP